MKLVLVRPNYKSHIITPPLGLGYLSSYLKTHGTETKIVDGLRDNLTPRQLFQAILQEKPDVVGITCLTAFYKETIQLSRALKKRNLKVIIGGVHPTFLPHQTLTDSQADYIICGEGEIALRKLLQNNFANEDIPGVYSLSNIPKDPTQVCKGERIGNLDDLPFPDWKQINPNTYPQAPHGAFVQNFPIGIIMTTRGCPYECSFCASPQFYERQIRFRTPENVIEEIWYLVKDFGVKEIHFEDDNLTLNRDHIQRICQLLLERNIQISWACPNGIRADKVDAELIKLMKESGCYSFAYGVESANPQILQNIRKHVTIDKVEESIALADRADISCQGFFIFGLPGETPATIEESIQFAKRSRLSRAQFLVLDILPGSELWDKLKGKFTPNWGKESYREPEWLPEGLTKKQLMAAQSRAFREFYLRPRILFKLLRSVRLQQIRFLLQRIREYRIIK